MKTAIFLGAGASAAENAPVQSALFRKFFESFASVTDPSQNLKMMYAALVEFFASVFRIDVEHQALGSISFPTFEEALGVLDLSELRGESLRVLGHEHQVPDSPDDILYGSNKVRLVRLYLILSMSKAIQDALSDRQARPTYPHGQLVSNLQTLHLLRDTVFISTNYDLLIDSAIQKRCGPKPVVDYGVEFAGPEHYVRLVSEYKGLRTVVLKIHGSLNWLHCQTCNNLKAFDRKVVMKLVDKPRAASCEYCQHLMSPVIVPPTYYKDMSNVFLSLIWNKAENALREVDHIIFCGYSFPDADMHIKYLLKRAQTNRAEPESLRFTVINNPPPNYPKSDDEKNRERERYERFLGKVTYDMERTFQDFAANPEGVYKV